MPTVSVVIPAFNAAATVGAAAASVLDQTYSDCELIVVNDGSTDGTAEAVASLGRRVRVVTTPNSGVSRARNTGVERSRGAYVAFLDADDLWMPTKLERQVAALDDEPSAGACYVGVVNIDGRLGEFECKPARHFDDLCKSLLLFSSVVPSSPSSLLVRRGVHEKIGGFDPRFSQCADWDYLLKLSLATTLCPVDENLVKYRVSAGSMSSDIALLERDTFAVLDGFYSNDPPAKYQALRNHCYSNHWMILAGSYLHAGQVGSSLRCLARGLWLWPRNIGRPLGLPLRWTRQLLQGRQRPSTDLA